MKAILIAMMVAVATAVEFDAKLNDVWNMWKAKENRLYSSEEEEILRLGFIYFFTLIYDLYLMVGDTVLKIEQFTNIFFLTSNRRTIWETNVEIIKKYGIFN